MRGRKVPSEVLPHRRETFAPMNAGLTLRLGPAPRIRAVGGTGVAPQSGRVVYPYSHDKLCDSASREGKHAGQASVGGVGFSLGCEPGLWSAGVG